MDDQLKQSALDFHEFSVPGKIQVSPTKPLATQRDLTLAYSPGAAVPYLEIEKDPSEAYKYTAHGNLVAVISNGTAVLGLSNTDALAGKSVMGGRGVLFKKSAGIDVFDAEVDKLGPDKFIGVVAALGPTSDGINLEDIRALECFYIEQKLRKRMNILVFHDDQHDTAITSTAAVPNGLRVVGKNISDMRMVVSDADAAAIACTNLLVALGLQKHNIVAYGPKGVIYQGREPNMVETKATYTVVDDGKRTLDDVIKGAGIFLGCSGPKVLTREMVEKMAHAPVILALANPEPGILPPLAKKVCPGAIICTGRSDYPNQVNNVLCFPFIFHGAPDVGATAINEETKLAAIRAITELAHAEQSEVMASAYGDQGLSFGPECIIPEPFNPHLIVKIASVVAKAAMKSSVATRPITDFDVYIDKLTELVYRASLFMKPIFSQTRKAPERVVLPEGEEACVLHATQELVTLRLTKPILTGRPNVIEMHIQKLGSQIKADVDFEIINNESNPRFKGYWAEYFQIMERRGVTQEQTQRALINNPTVIGTVMVQRGETDAMIYGTVGDYHEHFSAVKNVFGYRDGVYTTGAINVLLLPNGNIPIVDTCVNDEPGAEELIEITLMTAETIRRLGIEPRVAPLSHSNFGSSDCPSSGKMHQALELVRSRTPDLMIDGKMHGNVALVEAIRNDRMPDGPSKGSADILVVSNVEAARISYNLLRVSNSEDVAVGPVLMSAAKSVHVLTLVTSVCRVVNMVALAAVEARIQPL